MKFSKRQLIYLVVLITSIFFMCIGISQTIASQDIEKAAKNSVAAFLDAYLAGDYNKAIDYSKDTRDNLDREDRYEQLAKSKGTGEELLKYKILGTEKYNDELIGVTVELVFSKETITMKYPVIKEGKEWIVDVSSAIDVTNRLKGEKAVE
ncbi:hypothetical protein V3F56_13150 [Moorellaceae bacterium AZ2]